MKTRVRPSSWMLTVPLAGAAAAYMGFFLLPGQRTVGEIREQVKMKRDYISQAGSLPVALQIAQEKLKQTEGYTNAWKENSPGRGELSVLYGCIHEMAKAAGTATTRFDPEPIVEHETVCEVPLTMANTGSFGQIFQFLGGLETLPMEVWVKEFHLEKVGDSNGVLACEVSLVVFIDNSEHSDYVEYSE